LPILHGVQVTLREVRDSDAQPLCEALAGPEVREFIRAPPPTPEAFGRFIAMSHQIRSDGRGGCFAIVPAGATTPAGLFQLTIIDGEPLVVEWGFILGSSLWGRGVFTESARLVLDYAFDTLGAQRVEGRCAVENRRAAGAFRKLGAAPGAIGHEPSHFGRPLQGQTWTVFADRWRQRQVG
jgi:RimJ/RimL family protein N-acetyltransferase